ncbi:hypothetical protein P7C70_g8748, partial [Phenoliferia sp. Uapishka_3]
MLGRNLSGEWTSRRETSQDLGSLAKPKGARSSCIFEDTKGEEDLKEQWSESTQELRVKVARWMKDVDRLSMESEDSVETEGITTVGKEDLVTTGWVRVTFDLGQGRRQEVHVERGLLEQRVEKAAAQRARAVQGKSKGGIYGEVYEVNAGVLIDKEKVHWKRDTVGERGMKNFSGESARAETSGDNGFFDLSEGSKADTGIKGPKFEFESFAEAKAAILKGLGESRALREELAAGGGENERIESSGGEPIVHESFTAYKKVGKKVVPILAELSGDNVNPLFRPPMSRDPYITPLTPNPPEFEYGGRLTEEALALVDFGGEEALWPEEKKLFLHVLRLREKAVAMHPKDRGVLKSTYANPWKVATIPHVPWKQKPIPLPLALRDDIVKLLKERLASGLYEPSTSAYSGRWFVVKKKSGKLRIVHDLQALNAVTIRNSGGPPLSEELIDECQGKLIYSVIDVFGGYDEITIDEGFRDKTTFPTILGPMRNTCLPQGATNSVQDFQSIGMHILDREIPHVARIFVDDIAVKGGEDDYGGATIDGNTGIRRYVWEHAVDLERVLFRLEEAGLTGALEKLQVGVPECELLGVLLSRNGTRITSARRNKFLRYPTPTTVKEVRGFLGAATYVRRFIKDYANVAYPLRRLTHQNVPFVWGVDQQEAFGRLKQIIGEDILLKNLEYGPGAGKITLAVDSSNIAAGGALWQEDAEGVRRPVLWESVTFTSTEQRYSQPKLELAGVTKMLKKLQTRLWGQHFDLEVDALFLKQMINAPELPNSAMNRWLAFIHLFDFTVVHIAGAKHIIPDLLSRVERTQSDTTARSVENFIGNLGNYEAREVEKVYDIYFLEDLYKGEKEWIDLGRYLDTLERDEDLSDRKFARLCDVALKHYLKDGRIMKRVAEGDVEVIMDESRRTKILFELHENLGHRGRDETYRRAKARFWWPGMSEDVRKYVKSCVACQLRSARQERERKKHTMSAGVFTRIHFDCVHLGKAGYLVSGRDDVSGWVEARIIKKAKARVVAAFMDEDVISRYGLFGVAVVDGGSEF